MSGKRSIFEEVSEQTPKPAAQPGLIDAGKRGARGAIRVWLMLLFALVAVMIAVGGLTRLTDSGLSITEWRPVTGALPPMTPEAWAEEFDKYRAIPEYQLQNKGMSLAEFQFIYWWEWGHRQLGRVIDAEGLRIRGAELGGRIAPRAWLSSPGSGSAQATSATSGPRRCWPSSAVVTSPAPRGTTRSRPSAW